MNENLAQVRANPGYAYGQLAKAFVTASDHEDAATRRRAEERIRDWQRVARGMADGSLAIGSRTPVAGLPAWVTPTVVRGGFATGEAAAGGPLLPYETETAERFGLRAADRGALFDHYLTDAGVAELGALLDSGCYEVAVPEEAALLTVAWLLRAGDRAGALELLAGIRPFADRLRFAPRRVLEPPFDGTAVHRETVGDVRDGLAQRRRNRKVETMNEALRVWNPYADTLLQHWLETVSEGRVAAVRPEGWAQRGRELLDEYARLAASHKLCSKHRKPKENPAILRAALEDAVAGRALAPHRLGLLQHAVDSMVARRGAPGSERHTGLRERQAADALHESPYQLAQILIGRLSAVPHGIGLPSTDWVLEPVTADEALATGVTEGREFPDALRSVVERALSAPVATLVERGVVPSAEVLAELVPQLVAATTALSYRDASLRTLMTAVHRAFANRRSLLLVNLESQVRMDELPWVRAVAAYRRGTDDTRGNAHATLAQLGELALRAFPGTILPNPLLQELRALAKQSDVVVPFTEELAADIFMGTFSAKFLQAAQLAGELLEGSLYARYYGIDYAALSAMAVPKQARAAWPSTSTPPAADFAALCRERAGSSSGRSWVAANGKVIEQAQILTTHNLALLVHPVGVEPADGWDGRARGAFTATCRLVRQVHNNPRPLGTIKDAAYAWRQTVFFLSLCGLADQISVTAWMQDEAARQPDHVAARLEPLLEGLRVVLTGGTLGDGETPMHGRRFLGWSTDGHWMRG
ncbi:hypothetical protein [Yinghuangia seranimata]|uniref:hypothetical protein n=1 Tax=Yinghuangia seranimata TaxID=408067 RepID=UPI00248C9A21|nr:hypothetical protein [Yinghuangia seranimata]MDI2132737.1 hypothetical protein [Yinghuangia seranimata]